MINQRFSFHLMQGESQSTSTQKGYGHLAVGLLPQAIVIIFIFLLLFPFYIHAQESSPEFYLSTDKSFAREEIPYVNLEGPGYNGYTLRVYEIADPEKFLQEKVKERLVKETIHTPAFADPLQMLKKAFQYLRNDLRQIARKELNTKTRSSISKGLKMEYPKVLDENLAHQPILKEHRLVLSFSVPKAKENWIYKRIPVPLKDTGVYLVEAISSSHVGYSLVFKSDIHFVTKLSQGETLVYAARKDNGTPMDKATVKIWDGNTGEKITTGKTNSSGIFHHKGNTGTKSLILVIHENQYAVSDPNFYSSSFYGEGGIKTYLYTDRPVYRPGDNIYFKGIVRNFKKDSYFTSSGSGTVDVFTSNGDSIQTGISVKLSSTGTFDGECKAPEGEDVYLGVYNLVLNYENKTYSTEFSVDAYKKPTFLVKVKPEKQSFVKGEKVKLEMQAKYYHGKPLSGVEVSYQIFRKAKYDYSPVGTLNWEGTDAYLTSKETSGRREIVKSDKGTLGKDGTFTLSFLPENITEDFTYTVVASVRDSDTTLSGASSFSVNRSAVFIRVKKENQVYEPGSNVVLGAEIIPYDKSLSKEGVTKEVGSRKIKAILYRRKFQSISQESDRKKIDSFSEKTNSDGKAQFAFSIPERGHYVVRLETEDANGSETFAETMIWASAKSDSIEIPLKDISLTSGKDIYSIGDTAEILILSPVADANLLVTLEGSRILKYESIAMKGNSLKYSVKITPELSPNFTLSTVLFANRDTFAGQIKVVAPPENKFLKVKVKSDREIYKPGETVQLEINTSDLKQKGVKTEVSVAVVDEAIYQIQEDKNPSLISYFYHPRRNDVNTVYSSSYRFFGYSESRRMDLAFGKKTNLPLSALKEDDTRSREKFKDTALWNATVNTDSDGKAKLNFVLPDNLTSWRVTAVALTEDSKFGQTTSNFISRKSLSLQANLPAYLLRGEKQNISTTVTNFASAKEDVVVTLETSGGSVIGDATKKISLKPQGSELVSFTVLGDNSASTKDVSFKITAKGTNQDKIVQRVPLKFFGVKKIESTSLKLTPQMQNTKAALKLPSTSADERLMIRFSAGNMEALRSTLPYLIDYPYGCVEQTMSRFVPILAAQRAGAVSPKLQAELPKMASQGLQNLKSLLGKDGGFKWFSADSPEDVMMSAYVYRALSISKKLKQEPDDYILNRSRSYLYKVLESTTDPFQKAYILFSLSEGGEVEASMVESLSGLVDKQGVYGKALTGLVLHSAGNTDKAKEIFKKAISESGITNGKLFKEENTLENDGVETLSALLLLSVRVNEETLSDTLSEELFNRRSDIGWKNSRDTGMAVLALSEKLQTYTEKLTNISLTIRVNGKDFKKINAKPTEILSGKADWNFLVPNLVKGENTVELVKEEGGLVYAVVSLEYIDRSNSFSASEQGLKIQREYFSVNAEEANGKMNLTATKTNSFKPGELVMVSMEIERTGKSDSYFIVEDPLLPGFGFVRKDTNYYTGNYPAEYDSRQIYDDRAVFFVAGPIQKTTVRYFLRADMPGSYNAAPAAASLMYYPEVRGSSASDKLKVE